MQNKFEMIGGFPVPSGRPHEGMLVSLTLVSNRPGNFAALCENIEATVADPDRVELVVKIDDGDEPMLMRVREEKARRRFRITWVSTPPPGDHFQLWRSLNALLDHLDPRSYFICNVNDEVRFLTKGWDGIVARFVGFFDDDIFRLRVSRFKLRNYFSVWECYYFPDNFAFHTRRWIEIQGDWNACHVSDAFQQCVAYWLSLSNYPDMNQYNREVPIWGLDFANEEAGEGLSPEEKRKREEGSDRAWFTLMSHPMQVEILRRARLLQAHIWAHERGLEIGRIGFQEERFRMEVYGRDGAVLNVYSYYLSRYRIGWELFRERRRKRKDHFPQSLYYANMLPNWMDVPQGKFGHKGLSMCLTQHFFPALWRCLGRFHLLR